jgi:saccharopine dehydrogenase (NAD+, L-lysine-forming)
VKILLIGYGAVGEVIAGLFAHRKEVRSVLCVDYLDKKIINHPKISFKRLDMSNKNSFFELLKEHKFDLVINTATPRFNLLIMEGCLHAKSDYMDLASMWDPDPSGKPWSPSPGDKLKSPYKVEEFDYKDKFEDARIKGLIVAGVSPGLTNLFVREAAEYLDKIEHIKIRLIDYSGTDELYFAWSKEGLLDEIACNPLVYEDGKYVVMEPFSGEEKFVYPSPFRKQKVNLICQDEIGTLPFFIKADKIDIKDYDNLVNYHKSLYTLGLVSKGKIQIKGVEISPMEFACKVLPDVPTNLGDKKYENAQFGFVIELNGLRDKKKEAIRYEVIFPKQGVINEMKLNANFISYPTALSASLFALAMPKICSVGVFPPECLEKEVRQFIIEQLPKHKVRVRRKVYSIK